MSQSRIYVALSSFAASSAIPLELLRQSGHEFVLNTSGRRMQKAQVIDELKGFDAVVAGLEPYDAQVIGALPRLRCISRCGVGVDNIDLEAAKARGIAIFNTPDAVIQPVAELTVAMAFDLMRRLSEHSALMHARRWEKITGSQLMGKTVGVIGLGRIGKRTAQLFRRLDCRVIASDPKADISWAAGEDVSIVSLESLLIQSDIISIHLAKLDTDPFRLEAAHFNRMKPGVVLINTSRGVFCDEESLCAALKDGRVAGAGLDVFDVEPYAGTLCGFSNVVLTPHVATLTQESRTEMEKEAVKNVLKFLFRKVQ